MFESFTHLAGGSPWTYAVVLAIVAGDAVLPLLPGETAVLAAGLLAANGQLSIAFVVAAALAGAMLGDNLAYALGHSAGGRVLGRIERGEKARRRLAWSRAQIRRHGASIVVVARFIPGGRTASSIASGTLHMKWRRFLAADGVAALLWSCYAAGLGFFGGHAFAHSLWKPLALAAAVALVVTGIGELVRRAVTRDEPGPQGHGGR